MIKMLVKKFLFFEFMVFVVLFISHLYCVIAGEEYPIDAYIYIPLITAGCYVLSVIFCIIGYYFFDDDEIED